MFLKALHRAKRPLLIFGWGIHSAHAEDRFIRLAETLKVPYAMPWGAPDLNSPYYIGDLGPRDINHINWVIRQADWLLCIGACLGKTINKVGGRAVVWMVDIDQAELDKWPQFTGIHEDAKEFLEYQIGMVEAVYSHDGSFPDFSDWFAQIAAEKESKHYVEETT